MSRNAHPAGPRHGEVLPEPHAATAPADANALDPAIWPASARRVDGVLHVGGLPVTELVRAHGTPALFLDEDDLRSRARAYTAAFDGVDVYYAGKAFLCTSVARWIAEEGLGLDVCTGGELAVALAAQFPAQRIAMHGNNKSLAELTRAVEAVLAAPSLDLAGLHSHIGSQIFETSGFEVAAHRVVGLAATIRDVHGVQLEEINLGGGLGIAYVAGDDPESPKQTLERLAGIVEVECAAVGLRVPRLSVEPGRAIAGPSAVTVYEVGTVKDVTLDGGHTRSYVSVDGGMSDNIRTALYDADYTCVLAGRESSERPVLCRIVGKHCESGDVVVRDAWLPADVRPGDLVAVAATGAYCRSMASNYNFVPRPPVVAVRDGAARVIVRRETEADLLALDPGFAPLDRGKAADSRNPKVQSR
jgi:diaminopimelate decarboxylase